MPRPTKFLSLLLLPALFLSCDKVPEMRTYEEIYIKPKKGHFEMGMPHGEGFVHPPIPNDMSASPEEMKELMQSVAKTELTWRLPEGWEESPGSGMRLVTLKFGEVDGSIISLSGPAGGLEENVKRWMGQAGLDPTAIDLKSFLENQPKVITEENHSIQVVDLTSLQESDLTQNSILAGILEANNKTIFIKLTGPASLLKENYEKFLGFCKSLKFTNENLSEKAY